MNANSELPNGSRDPGLSVNRLRCGAIRKAQNFSPSAFETPLEQQQLQNIALYLMRLSTLQLTDARVHFN
jgi:hypothetical protein